MSSSQHPAYLLFPDRAEENRTLPKSKFYEYGNVSTRVREYFVRQVEKITLQYVLASSTTNLPSTVGLSEFHIFRLELKTPELNPEVLHCIDTVWPFRIIFELRHGDRTKVIAAYKRPGEADASRWVLSDYFATDWLPASTPRAAMPLALDLAGLYEQLLHRLIPLPPRPQESLAEQVDRVGQVRAKQREVDKAAARLAKERQFNRKVEINAQLRQLKNELEHLSH